MENLENMMKEIDKIGENTPSPARKRNQNNVLEKHHSSPEGRKETPLGFPEAKKLEDIQSNNV